MRTAKTVMLSLLMLAGLAQTVAADIPNSAVRVTRVEARKVVLNWVAEPGAASYSVSRDGATIAALDDTWFVATGLEPETEYTFSIVTNTGLTRGSVTVTTAHVPLPPTTVDVWWVGPKGLTMAFGFGEFEIRRDGEIVVQRAGRVFTDTNLTPNTTYRYEIRPIDAAGNLGPAIVQTLTTTSLLSKVQGVSAELIEPGIIQVNWRALDPTTRYRVYINGELKTVPTKQGTTSTRVSVPTDATSVVQVAGYNGGGGPLSDPVSVTSGPIDPRQIGLEVRHSWPGTVVVHWRHRATTETVLVDGEPVGTARRGWLTIRDLRYNADINVSVLTNTPDGPSESISYPIRTSLVQVGDVRSFSARAVTSTSVKLNWRKSPFVNFEVTRDGVVIATLTQRDAVPFFDTGLMPGTTYTYTIREIAEGATGVSNPVAITVTTSS